MVSTRKDLTSANPYRVQAGVERLSATTNDSESLFHARVPGMPSVPTWEGIRAMSPVCLLPGPDLIGLRVAFVVVAPWVLSGVVPQLSATCHWWFSWGLFATMTAHDGGDPVTAVSTVLLIPICLVWPGWLGWRAHPPTTDPPGGSPARRARTRVASAGRGVLTALLGALARQVSLVHLQSAIAKLGTPSWPQGTAMWYRMQDPLFGVAGTPYQDRVPAVFAHPVVTVGTTWGTLVVELALGLSTLTRCRLVRRLRLVLAISLHASIIVVLGIGTFGLQMIGAAFLVYAVRRSDETRPSGGAASHRSRERRLGDGGAPVGSVGKPFVTAGTGAL